MKTYQNGTKVSCSADRSRNIDFHVTLIEKNTEEIESAKELTGLDIEYWNATSEEGEQVLVYKNEEGSISEFSIEVF